MSFDNNIDKPQQYRITLVEIDEPIPIEEFINYEAGIWFKSFDKSRNAEDTSSWPLSYYAENEDTTYITNVKSLKIGTEDYTRVDNFTDLRDTNKSFYYDLAGDVVSPLVGLEELYLDFLDSDNMGRDRSTAHNNGTPTAVTQVAGPFDKAGSWNGSTSELDFDNPVDLSYTNDWSIVIRVKYDHTAQTTGFPQIFTPDNNDVFLFGRLSSSTGTFRLTGSLDITYTGLGDNTWHTIILSYDSTANEITSNYDGTETTHSVSSYTFAASTKYFLGHLSWSSHYLGDIATFRIFSRTLTATQRTNLDLYNGTRRHQTVYIHFDNYEWPLDKIVRLGSVKGYADKTDSKGNSYYGTDIEQTYKVKVKSVPVTSKSQDPLKFGALKFQNASLTFFNADGEFDDFKDGDFIRQPARVLFGFDGIPYSEFVETYEGFIDKIEWGEETFRLAVMDKRKNLQRSIPERLYDKNIHADLNEDNNGKEIPLAYGPILNAPTMCLDETLSSPTNNVFQFMDTDDNSATSIDTVYRTIDDVKEDITSSVLNADLNAGTFELTHSVAFDTSASPDSLYRITIDFHGANITNALGVVKDLLLHYDDQTFINTNFNTVEWTNESLNALDVGVYLGKPKQLIKYLEKILGSSLANFFIQDDGLRTARIFYQERDISKVIYPEEWFDKPKFDRPDSEFLSSCIVRYNQDNSESDNFAQYTNKNFEQEALTRYKSYESKTYTTFLTSETDAIAYSDKLMERASNITYEVKRSTTMSHYDLELMDFIVADHSRPSGDPEWAVYEIIGISKDTKIGQISLTMKFIRSYEFPAYVQGYIYGNKIYGDKLYGPTEYEEQ